jgi:DNA-binding NarL/FixJ family response regulator
MSQSPNNILLLEDLPHVSQWLLAAIGQAFPAATTQLAETRADGLRLVANNPFDLTLIDIGLPDGSGMDVLHTLVQQQPACLNVMSTVFDDDQHVFQALRMGAKGYVLKDQSKADLSRMLEGITLGHYPISPAIANKLLHFFQPPVDPQPLEKPLTPRESEVLTLLAKGITVPQVAGMLSLQASTCYGYVKDIYRKLNINSRAEATLAATRMGLISPQSD